MTEATRTIALQAAAQVLAGNGDADLVLAAAEKFHAFVVADLVPPTASRATAGSQKPQTLPGSATKPPGKAPAAPKPAAKPPVKTEEQVADEALAGGGENAYEANKEGVGAVVAALIAKGAEARKEAIALLKKYGATSVSGVKESDYEAFVAEGSEILAALTAADLTA